MIKKLIRYPLLISLIVIGIIGIVLTYNSVDFMGGSSVFMYFTVQSNLFIIAMAALTIIQNIFSIILKRIFINQIILFIKFAATIAITITFIVFFTMLAPLLGADYLASFANLSLHGIVPILAVIDFILFDTDIKISYPKSLFGLAMPLYYVIFVYVGVPLNFRYGQDIKFPYFFLDYEKNGFMFEKGFGIIPWIIVLVIGICLLCFLFAFIMKCRQKVSLKKA